MADRTAHAMYAGHDAYNQTSQSGSTSQPYSPSRKTRNRGVTDSVTLFAEHGLQEIRHPCCRIGPYLLLFLSYHKKKAVQGFIGHIVININ
jgi:hypothetical protein